MTTYQILVVPIEIATSMEFIGTALGYRIDGTTGKTTLANIERSDIYLNLVNSLHRNRLRSCLTTITAISSKTEHVVIHHTINLE